MTTDYDRWLLQGSEPDPEVEAAMERYLELHPEDEDLDGFNEWHEAELEADELDRGHYLADNAEEDLYD